MNYMCFCTYVKHNLLNVYRSKRCRENVNIYFLPSTLFLSFTVFEIIEQELR
jgi:hypothetical protein